MQIPFRQGIVKATPNFLQLTGSAVSIVIPEPAYVLVTVTDNASNYLFAEKESVANVWVGPFVAGTDYWLYWELHPVTGAKVYGHTLYEPIESAVAPQMPYNDQHWYDIASHKMKVWNAVANRWVERIRVFAARLTSSSQLVSMSINSPAYEGTQVGSYVSVPVVAGYLVLDNDGKAIRKGNGKFFTTEDAGVTGVGSSSQVKFNSIVREAEAAANMAKHTVVAFVDFDTISPADPIMVSQGKLFGIIEEDVVIGDYVNVVFDGSISSADWDWTHLQMNTPLYIGEGGALSTTATAPALNPIAVVSGVHTIQFGVPKVVNTIVGGVDVGVMTPTTQGTGKLSVAAVDSNDPVVVGDNDPRLTDARIPLVHTHVIDDVSGLQGALDALAPIPMTETVQGVGRLSVAATIPADPIVVGDNDPRLTDNRLPLAHSHTISEVLNLQTTLDSKVDMAGSTMTGSLILSADPTTALEAATKQYVDAHAGGGGSTVVYHPIVGSKDGFVAQTAGVEIANGFQQYGVRSKISVTDPTLAPIFRVDWSITYDPYAVTPNAVAFALRVNPAASASDANTACAWVTFTDQTAYLGTPFVNPYAYAVTANPVASGIPLGKHHEGLDYNMLSITQPMSTPPAFLMSLAPGITPTSLTGLIPGTSYPLQFRLLHADFWAPPISTVDIVINGTDAQTVEEFIEAVNNAVEGVDGGSIRCAWSFGNALVFVQGENDTSQNASYLDIDIYAAGGPFETMHMYHTDAGFWAHVNNIPATGPQPSDPYATNANVFIGGLRWYVPTVASSTLTHLW